MKWLYDVILWYSSCLTLASTCWNWYSRKLDRLIDGLTDRCKDRLSYKDAQEPSILPLTTICSKTFIRNSEGQFQIFSAAGVVPTRELWPYESILDFARAGNHIRTWGAPPLCPSVMAVVMRFNGAEKNYTYLYMHNFQTNWARKSRLVRIGQVFNLLKNLTNRDFLAWIV